MGHAGSDGIIRIAGAGPAGIASAITLARIGWRVVVHEAQREVGSRFQGDLQGLESQCVWCRCGGKAAANAA